MKKINLTFFPVLALLVLTMGTANAKKGDIFSVGDNNLNIQLGAGNNWYYDNYYHTSLPQLSVSYDYGLRDDWGPGVFGIGAFVSLCSYRYSYPHTDNDYRVSEFNLAGRSTYHYQFFDRVDTYGGIVLGLKFKTDNIPENDIYDNEEGIWPMGAILAGIKYYFTDNFSVMSELYAGQVAFFNIGIGLKF